VSSIYAAAFGDLHFPWVHRSALKKAIGLLHRDMTHVVQIGDLYDWYSASRFPRSHNLITPEQETEKGRKLAEEFWHEVKAKCPHAKLVQLKGNHCDRPLKNAAARAPELVHLLREKVESLYRFAGVRTIESSADDFRVGSIVFTHGFLAGLGDHAKASLLNTVRGHSHRGGTVWVRPGLWELDCGFLGDDKAPVFGYSAWKRSYRMTKGLGIVDSNGPRFIPL
jgi:hypothetical protein